MTIINSKSAAMIKGRAASGSITFNCGDAVASALDGWPSENTQEMAESLGIWDDKYDTLNPGHRRMIIGQRLRAKLNKIVKEDGEDAGSEWLHQVAIDYGPEPQDETEAA